ncbi:3-ketoacyl-ACP reductase [Roseobacter sp. S98]|uniref:3-ketoacyl-ACP reductase n=1 Tax=Roseobacter algicola (ex Choi et al. 2025) (nom. illeg.) TaxID=3092138 RepID=UPI0035C6B587
MNGTALITGGQRGIGLGIARALDTAGMQVVLTSEKDGNDPEVHTALAKLSDRAMYLAHDLRQPERVRALFDAVEARAGAVTCLVSNAGVPAPVRGDMLDVTPDSFDFVMDVNLRGGFFLAQETARRMQVHAATNSCSIVFVTSVSASMVSVERSEYCISKSAASMMASLFAARLAGDGIGVFELRPGIIETDMTAAVRDRYDPMIADGFVPAKRWGQPEDIGKTVRALVSGDLAYSTGSVIPVDGGLSIQRL